MSTSDKTTKYVIQKNLTMYRNKNFLKKVNELREKYSISSNNFLSSYQEIPEKEKLQMFGSGTYWQDIVSLCRELHLTDEWLSAVNLYVRYNVEVNFERNTLEFLSFGHPVTGNPQLFLRLFWHTGLSDIIFNWSSIKSQLGQTFINYKNTKRPTKNNFEHLRNIMIYNLYLENKTVKQICDALEEFAQQEGDASKADSYLISDKEIRSVIKRMKRLFPKYPIQDTLV